MENIDYYNCTDILCCVIYTFIVAICDAPVILFSQEWEYLYTLLFNIIRLKISIPKHFSN